MKTLIDKTYLTDPGPAMQVNHHIPFLTEANMQSCLAAMKVGHDQGDSKTQIMRVVIGSYLDCFSGATHLN